MKVVRTYNCRNCSKLNKFRGHSYANTYCDNVCQQAYQIKERVRRWLEEGKSWKTNIPSWAKNYLIEQRGRKCEVCDLAKHCGYDIPLECDHVDGNHLNNIPSNLRLICPNCHSQTPTYKNRNRGYGRKYRKKSLP